MINSLLTLRELLTKNHLEAALLSNNATIKYLTGYYGFSSIERDAFLLITKKNIYLFTSPLYAKEVKSQTTGILIKERTVKSPFAQQFSGIVVKEGLKKIGIEDEDLTVAEYQILMKKNTIQLFPLSLQNLRVKKTDKEIVKIQKACEVGDIALKQLQELIKPGMSELEVAFELELIIRKTGASISFPTIVAFGPNSAIPHHHTDNTKLKKEDVILIDFGVMYENYCSDMSRTFFIGKPTKKQKEVYNIVLKSQQKAVEFLYHKLTYDTPVIKAGDVDKVARDFIISQGYPSIPHSLGHGIGLEVHESPSLSPLSKEHISEGMVFSIEPGIYLPNEFGVRIEDLYAIQNGVLIQLTQAKNSF